MKKTSTTHSHVDLNRVYRGIGDKPGVKRLFALALKKIDSGEKSVTFSAAELVKSRVYRSEHCAQVGFDRLMTSLAKVRSGRALFFSSMEKSGDVYTLMPNASLNLASAVLGFRALPDAVLAAPAARPRAKMRDLVFAIFCEVQKLAPRLARDGFIDIPFRVLQARMDLPDLSDTASAVGKITLRDPLERAIARLDALSVPGLSIAPHYVDGNIGEYLDESFLTVTFSGDLLTSFLAAFGLEAAVKPEPNHITAPLVDVTLHPLVGVLADRREMLEQGIEYIKKERLWAQKTMKLSGVSQARHTSYAALGDQLATLEARLALYDDVAVKSCADDPEEVVPYLFEMSDFYSRTAHLPTVTHQAGMKFAVMGAEAYIAATMVQDEYKIPEPEVSDGVIMV